MACVEWSPPRAGCSARDNGTIYHFFTTRKSRILTERKAIDGVCSREIRRTVGTARAARPPPLALPSAPYRGWQRRWSALTDGRDPRSIPVRKCGKRSNHVCMRTYPSAMTNSVSAAETRVLPRAATAAAAAVRMKKVRLHRAWKCLIPPSWSFRD